MKIFNRPFAKNQIVKAQVSYRPSVIAGNCYRVLRVTRARSYTGWMVGVAALDQPSELETLDAGYFSQLNYERAGAPQLNAVSQ